MKIIGAGIISQYGRGLNCQCRASSTGSGQVPVDALKDKQLLKGMRRADRFCKMAALAACDALIDAGKVPRELDQTVGLIVVTALGPDRTTFAFLDDIIDYGDSEVSPIKFSHSVHNAAAYYVATATGSRGPATTLASFQPPFDKALQLARGWLALGRADLVLAGCVEERSEPFERIHFQQPDTRSRLQPFRFGDGRGEHLTEGAAFVLVGPGDGLGDEENVDDIPSLLRLVEENKKQ